jgi:hypothetical protein
MKMVIEDVITYTRMRVVVQYNRHGDDMWLYMCGLFFYIT